MALLVPSLVLVAASAWAGDAREPQRELEVARRAHDLIEDRLQLREEDLSSRVRTLYKITRSGMAPLWVDEESRASLARSRAAARRVILRDLEERRALRNALEEARDEIRDLEAEAREARVDALAPVPEEFLSRPTPGRVVARAGLQRDPKTGARYWQRGIEIAAEVGEEVGAPAPGTVVFVGPVYGLASAVIIDHGAGLLTVTGGLERVTVAAGSTVDRGAPIGRAVADRVYLELRRGGDPVDPRPALRRPGK